MALSQLTLLLQIHSMLQPPSTVVNVATIMHTLMIVVGAGLVATTTIAIAKPAAIVVSNGILGNSFRGRNGLGLTPSVRTAEMQAPPSSKPGNQALVN